MTNKTNKLGLSCAKLRLNWLSYWLIPIIEICITFLFFQILFDFFWSDLSNVKTNKFNSTWVDLTLLKSKLISIPTISLLFSMGQWWPAGGSENKANSVQLELLLGLSLEISPVKSLKITLPLNIWKGTYPKMMLIVPPDIFIVERYPSYLCYG